MTCLSCLDWVLESGLPVCANVDGTKIVIIIINDHHCTVDSFIFNVNMGLVRDAKA